MKYLSGSIIAATIILGGLVTYMGVVFNYINSKVITIQIGCVLIIAFGIITFSSSELLAIIKKSRIVQLVIVWIAVLSIATVWGADVTLSFFGHFERGTGLWFTLLTSTAAFFAVLLARNYHAVREMILYPIVIVGSGLGISVWMGHTGLAWSSSVIVGLSSAGGGAMGNSSMAATVMLMSFFVGCYVVATQKKTWGKIAWGAVTFFSIINPVLIALPFFTPLSGTVFGFIGDARAATIATLLGLIIVGVVYALRSSDAWVKTLGKWMMGIIIAGAAIGSVMVMIPKTSMHHFFVATTGQARFIYWTMAAKQIAHHPLLGTGPETFRYAHEKYFDPRLLTQGEPWADKPHSVYFEMGIAGGLVGLGLYLGLLGLLVYRLMRYQDTKFSAWMIGLLIAYMVNNVLLFDSMTSTWLFALLVMIIAAHTEYPVVPNQTVSAHSNYYEKNLRIIAVLVIIISQGIMITHQVKKLQGAWDELLTKAPERSLLYVTTERASPYGAGISFAQRADIYAEEFLRDTRTDPTIIISDIIAVNNQLLDTMSRYPANMQSYSALGKLALAMVTHTKIISPPWYFQLKIAAERIAELSPNNPTSTYFFDELKKMDQYLIDNKKTP